MPGSPIVYYGDEIGMGDNVFIGDRNGVRTPMQWSRPQCRILPLRSAAAVPAADHGSHLRLPLRQRRGAIARPEFPLVLDQAHARGAQEHPRRSAAARGAFAARQPQDPRLYLREYGERQPPLRRDLFAVRPTGGAQPSRVSGRVPLGCSDARAFPPIGDLPYLLTLSGYGFYWFKLTKDAEAPPRGTSTFLSLDERPVLVLFDGWSSLFRDRVVPWRIGMAERTRVPIETDTLPRLFIETSTLVRGRRARPSSARAVVDHIIPPGEVRAGSSPLGVSTSRRAASHANYFMPLALAWEERDEERVRNISTAAHSRSPAAIERRRDGRCLRGRGVLPVAGRGDGEAAGNRHGARESFEFRPTAAFKRLAGADAGTLPAARPAGFQLQHHRPLWASG